jgi:hypothetical protein
MFSTILDISSFFIGMLINLLLIALICYYFKRKYETLEASQNEQAKILYNLIQNQLPKKTFDINDLITNANLCSNLGTCMVNPDDIEESESEDETDSESESETDGEDEDKRTNLNIQVSEVNEDGQIKVLSVTELNDTHEVEDLEPIVVNKLDDLTELNVENAVTDLTNDNVENDNVVNESGVTDYSKLSIKQLKDILTKKGINSNHRMKKTDLINLIEHGHLENTLNLKDEIEEVNI